MKTKFIILLLTCVLSVTAYAQPGTEPQAMTQLVPDQKTFDFGTIYEKNGKVRHTFRLTNRSRQTLFITEANTWCGCTATDFSRKPIRPGETARVTVTFDPERRPGSFTKEVVLMLNDGRYYTRLWIKGNVVAVRRPVTEDHHYHLGGGLYVSKQTITFNELPVGKSYNYQWRVANETNRTMKVEFQRLPNNRVLKMPQQLILKPYERRLINIGYTFYKPRHFDRHIMIDVWVNGQKVSPLRIQWNGPRRFSW